MRAGYMLGRRTFEERCVLDAHDSPADVYNADQISTALSAAGLQVLGIERAGNGVGASATSPVEEKCAE